MLYRETICSLTEKTPISEEVVEGIVLLLVARYSDLACNGEKDALVVCTTVLYCRIIIITITIILILYKKNTQKTVR